MDAKKIEGTQLILVVVFGVVIIYGMLFVDEPLFVVLGIIGLIVFGVMEWLYQQQQNED